MVLAPMKQNSKKKYSLVLENILILGRSDEVASIQAHVCPDANMISTLDTTQRHGCSIARLIS